MGSHSVSQVSRASSSRRAPSDKLNVVPAFFVRNVNSTCVPAWIASQAFSPNASCQSPVVRISKISSHCRCLQNRPRCHQGLALILSHWLFDFLEEQPEKTHLQLETEKGYFDFL